MNNIICPACGGGNPESTKFCMNCGNALQAPAQPPVQPQQPAVEQHTYTPEPQQPAVEQQPYNYYQPAEEPKKMKTWVKVLIIVVAVFLIIGIVGAIFGESIPYTKGEVKDGTYVNEWANIKFDIPEGMKDKPASELDLEEGCELGYAGTTEETDIVIGFTKQPAGANAEGVIKAYEDDPSFKIGNPTMEKDTQTIAGAKYQVLKIKYPETAIEYEHYFYVYARVIEGRSVEIIVDSFSEKAIEDFIKSIEKAK